MSKERTSVSKEKKTVKFNNELEMATESNQNLKTTQKSSPDRKKKPQNQSKPVP